MLDTAIAEPMPTDKAIEEAVNSILRPYQVASETLGASKIATYLKCPLEYKLRYIERRQAPLAAPATLGSAIHAVIAHGHAWRWTDRDADKAAEMLEGIWDALSPETVLHADEPAFLVSYRQARDVWVPWYLWWQREQETVAVEQRWECEVPGREGVTLRGTIDRVYLDGAPVVSDVKCGARAPSRAQLATSLQLSIYSWAFRNLCGDRETLELVHLRGCEAYRTSRTEAYLSHVMAEVVVPVIDAIEAGLFPAHPGSLYGCSYCTCRSFCPIGQGGDTDDGKHGHCSD